MLGVHAPNLGALTTAGLIIIGYFGVLPALMNSQTIGQKLTRLQVARTRGGPARWYQHIGRVLCVGVVFCVVPLALVSAIYYMMRIEYVSNEGALVLGLAVLAFYVFLTLLELIRAAIRKPLFYERWTDTRIISTTSIKPASDDNGTDDRRGNATDDSAKTSSKAIANDDNS